MKVNKCMIHPTHQYLGTSDDTCRFNGDRYSKAVTARSRPRVVLSPEGELFRVIEWDTKRNHCVLTPIEVGIDAEEPNAMWNNRISALVTAGYQYPGTKAQQRKWEEEPNVKRTNDENTNEQQSD